MFIEFSTPSNVCGSVCAKFLKIPSPLHEIRFKASFARDSNMRPFAGLGRKCEFGNFIALFRRLTLTLSQKNKK